jgi:hypothetical protein
VSQDFVRLNLLVRIHSGCIKPWHGRNAEKSSAMRSGRFPGTLRCHSYVKCLRVIGLLSVTRMGSGVRRQTAWTPLCGTDSKKVAAPSGERQGWLRPRCPPRSLGPISRLLTPTTSRFDTEPDNLGEPVAGWNGLTGQILRHIRPRAENSAHHTSRRFEVAQPVLERHPKVVRLWSMISGLSCVALKIRSKPSRRLTGPQSRYCQCAWRFGKSTCTGPRLVRAR